jgi:hypothetical protein
VTLWLWGINNADRDGEMNGADRADLEALFEINLSRKLGSAAVVEALIATGWVDEVEGRLVIHDWPQWQELWYKALERREKDRQRKRSTAEPSEDIPQDIPQNLHGISTENPQIIHGNSSATVTRPSPAPLPSSDRYVTKEESKGAVAPSVLDLAIEEFEAYRKKLKAPMTERAVTLLRSELNKLAGDDEDLKVRILNQSILQGWKGVFPLHVDTARASPSGNIFAELVKEGALK